MKSRRIAEVQQALRQGDFARARQTLEAALQEFPGDAELLELQTRTADMQQRTEAANQLFASGQQKAAAGDLDGAVADLRRARQLDDLNPILGVFLVEYLTRLAQSLLDTDANRAEQLIDEAAAIDPKNANVEKVRQFLVDAQLATFAAECTTWARRLMANGELNDALGVVDQALIRCPDDLNLQRLKSQILAQLRPAEAPPTPPKPEPPKPEPVRAQTPKPESKPAAAAAPPPPVKPVTKAPEPKPESPTQSFDKPAAAPPPISSSARPTRDIPAPAAAAKPAAPKKPTNPKTVMALAGGAALLVIGGLVAFLTSHRTQTPVAATVASITITSQPEGAEISVDGQAKGTAGPAGLVLELPPGKHRFRASKAGYEPVEVERQLDPGATGLSLPMTWLAPVLTIVSDLWGASVRIDEWEPVKLPKGEHTQPLPQGAHTLTLDAGSALVKVPFDVSADGKVTIQGDVSAREARAVAIAQSPQSAAVRAIGNVTEVTLDEQKINPKATDPLAPLAPGPHNFRFTDGKDFTFQGAVSIGKTSSLALLAKSDQNVGDIVLELNVGGARITGDSAQGKTIFTRDPSKVTAGETRISAVRVQKIKLTIAKEGYFDWVNEVDVKKGVNKIPVTLQAKPTFGILTLTGLPPNTTVFIGPDRIGVTDSQGTLRSDRIQPGERTIRLQNRQFREVQITRRFTAGQTVALTANDLKLSRAPGVLEITLRTEGAQIRATKGNGPEISLKAGRNDLEEGEYRIRASAPKFNTFETTIRVAPGETAALNIRLDEAKAQEAPKPPPNPLARFAGSNRCKLEGEWATCQQGLYSIPLAQGIYQFRLRVRGAKPRAAWRLYLNPKANRKGLLFVLDRTQFQQIHDRTLFDKKFNATHKLDLSKDIPVRIEVRANQIVHTILDTEYTTPKELYQGLDTSGGLFAFEVGKDESISIAQFTSP